MLRPLIVMALMGLCFYGLVLIHPDARMAEVLLSSLGSAFQSPITYLIVALLGGASLLGMTLLARGERHAERLAALTKRLDAVALQHPEGLVGADLDEAREVIENEPALLPAWEEFMESLTTYRGVPHRSASAETFFPDDRFLEGVEFPMRGVSLRWSFLEQLPGLMTGLGMLGTFGGIALGLGQLGGIEAGGGAQIVASIGGVVVGLASAFWTSIFGLLLALSFSTAHSQREGTLLQRLSRFREALERVFPRLTPEKILRDQHETLVESREAQRELLDLQRRHILVIENTPTPESGSDGGSTGKIEAALAQLVSLNEQQLGMMRARAEDESPQWTTLIEAGQQQLEVLHVMREESEESRSQLQTIAADLADSLGQQLDSSLQRHLGPQIERLLEMVEGQVTQAAELSVESTRAFTAQMVSQLDGSVRGSFEEMAGVVSNFTQGFGSTATQMNALLGEMHGALTLQRDVMSGSLEAADAMQRQAESLFERWSAREEGLLGRYHEASSQFIEAFEASGDVASRLSDFCEDLDARRESISQLLTLAGEVQARAQEAAETVTMTMDRSTQLFSGAAGSLRMVSTDTLGWVETTTQAIDRFGAGLSSALKDSLVTYDGSLSQAVRSLSTAVHELEDLTFSIAEQHAVARRG